MIFRRAIRQNPLCTLQMGQEQGGQACTVCMLVQVSLFETFATIYAADAREMLVYPKPDLTIGGGSARGCRVDD